jgi:hypothetical protein
MTDWWNSLPAPMHFFYFMAFMGSCLLVIQIILLIVGLDHLDVHSSELNSGGGHSSGLYFLSIRSLSAFCTGLGWFGVFTLKWGAALPLAVLLAILMGLILAWLIIWLMDSMRFLASDGTMDYANAINGIGTVIVSIQAVGQSGGQVEIMVQGRLAVINAIGDAAGPAIPPGTKVKVTGLTDPTTLRVISV